MADVVTCPDCGAENPSTKIKCGFCGRLLGAVEQAAAEERDARSLTPLKGGRRAEMRVDTTGERVTDITEQIATYTATVGGSGLLNAFVQHATAGIGIMETGSGSEADLNALLDRMMPPDDRYVHDHGAIGHGRDHLLPVFVSPSVTIPVDEGRPALGTWQRIVLIDTNVDNNERYLRLTFLSSRSE